MRFGLLGWAILAGFGSAGCAALSDRKVGHGGKAWSLADIFPEGADRDLAAAAGSGDLRGIDRAIAAGANINFRGAHDLTPLWWAAWNRNLAGFERLLERGADPNVVPSESEPVIHLVAQALWPVGFLKALLKHGAHPDLEDRYGRRPIAPAIIQGTREHVEALLAKGINLNSIRPDGGSAPLFAAVMAGRYDYVLLLLQKGADYRAMDGLKNDLAHYIGLFPFDPNSEHYVWRERVIRFLRSKGIEASPPVKEGQRTKPLPPDLRN